MTSTSGRTGGGGFIMIFPASIPEDQARRKFQQTWVNHVTATVTSGVCPYHDTIPLLPVPASDGSTSGYCATCRVTWRACGDRVSWELSDGQPAGAAPRT